MRKSRMTSMSVLLTAGATILPLLASTTRAIGASPWATQKIGTQLTELSGSLPFVGGLFGKSVAVSGTTVVVGSPGKAQSPGAAFVFSKTANGWSEVTGLMAWDGVIGDNFGFSVAISGSTAVVGAPGVISTPTVVGSPGRAYVFTDTAKGWLQVAELKGSNTVTDDNFGYSVAISGTTALVGAPGHEKFAGRVYVFARSGAVWRQVAQLKDSNTVSGESFGYSVTVSGTTAVVGACDLRHYFGRAYVFSQTAGRWKQVAQLKGSDTVNGDNFGYSVAVSGTTAVVGAPGVGDVWAVGRAYGFAETAKGWLQVAELAGSGTAAGDHFGTAVAISGTTVVVGAPEYAHWAGAAYVFTKTTAGWTEVRGFSSSDTVAGNEFGTSVAISGTTTVAGVPFAGRAYVLET